MTERVLPEKTKYYTGGTVPRTAGPDGVTLPNALADSMHLPKPDTIYRGGTISVRTGPRSVNVRNNDPETDQDGRVLFQ